MALTTVKSDQIQTSVALAGSPTTTTQSASDNSTKIATTAYADTAVANLVASAPAALNTLDELAAALNDDASFSTTITNSIATKLPLAGGTLTGDLILGANVKLEVGSASGGDLQIYHNGSHSYIDDAGTGNLYIRNGSKNSIFARTDGEIILYYNNSGKLATNSGGVTVTGTAILGGATFVDNATAYFGTGLDLRIYHDGSNSYIKNNTGWLNMPMGGSGVSIANSDFSESIAKFLVNGACELYHNGSKKIETTSTGITVTGSVTADGLDVLSTSSGTSRTIRVASTASTGDNDATMIISNGGSGDAMLRFDYEGTNTDRARIGVSSSAQQLEFYTAGNNQRMLIDSSGNVIINKSNFSSLPTGSKLNIFGDGVTLRLDGSSGTTKSILFRQTNAGNPGEVYADGSLRFRTEDASTRITFHTNSSGSNNERMRIDSSGDILFGGITDKNVFNNTSGTGTSINNTAGEVQIANNNDTCLYLNRMGNNGTLVSLRQAGTNYGTIGIYGGAPYIGHASGGFMFNGATIEPTAGVNRTNNTVDLGSSTYRFKELYLSGGIYVGGTGATNYLDDYEEGNWTPTIVGNSGATGQSYNIQYGRFTKIGSFVHYTFDVQLSTLGTLSGTYAVIGGLPFAGTGNNLGGTANIGYHNVGGYAQPLGAYISGSNVYLMEHGNAGTDYLTIGENKITNSSRIIGSLIVHTPS